MSQKISVLVVFTLLCANLPRTYSGSLAISCWFALLKLIRIPLSQKFLIATILHFGHNKGRNSYPAPPALYRLMINLNHCPF
ncbi:hypothetical protein B0F90DRAFT_1731124 [Multifurca ochricompacta]|uniref:Secreted protein n=1 Tax=Multifurca ochricompacta TaxID=376703 RepID=A0AAD4M3C2_9AGAM|nr:hypothetical protein B0F90DRAFT_1731124 [Multifurca ochricompacta]